MKINIPDEVVEAVAKQIAAWINYSWDGLHDRDLEGLYKDWAYNGIGDLSMQGGKPALRRIARATIAAGLAAWTTPTHKPIKGRAMDEIGGSYPALILPLKEDGE